MIQYTVMTGCQRKHTKVKRLLRKFFHGKNYYYHFLDEGTAFYVRTRHKNRTFEKLLKKNKIQFFSEDYLYYETEAIRKHRKFWEYNFNFFNKLELWKLKKEKRFYEVRELIERFAHILSNIADLSFHEEAMLISKLAADRTYFNGKLSVEANNLWKPKKEKN